MHEKLKFIWDRIKKEELEFFNKHPYKCLLKYLGVACIF